MMKQFLLVHGEGFIKPQYNKALMQVYDVSFLTLDNGFTEDDVTQLLLLKVGEAIRWNCQDKYASVVRIA